MWVLLGNKPSFIFYPDAAAGLESMSEEHCHLTHDQSDSCEVDQLSSVTEVHEEVTNEEEDEIGEEIHIKVEDAFDAQVS